jgi:threonine 3-dehydrogenase
MRALIVDVDRSEWESTQGMKFASVEEPSLNESQNPDDASKVLIKPIFTGFCGSDKSIWFRHAFKDMIFDSLESSDQPHRISGHELLGEIVEVGSYAKKAYGYRPGDTVSTESHIFCGRCHQCKIGDQHVCSDHLIIGISTDGCFAETVKLPAKELWKTDIQQIRPEVAAIQEPFGNAVHACSRLDLRGKTVALFGCGTIGLFAILIARAMGATTIIGVDHNDRNLKLAERLGVDKVLKADREKMRQTGVAPDMDLVEAIRKQCFGEGVDVALELAGSNQALNTAIEATRAGGNIVLFGLSEGDYTLTNFQKIIMHGKSMHSVVGRKVFQTWYTVSNLLQSKEHGLQEKIYDVILNKGEGTVHDFHGLTEDRLESVIQKHPKIILRY